jgi:cell wall-associated NlpC family hydrolase
MTRSYVGIPFVKRGWTREGCHCWGLVRLVYQEEVGIELPTYGEVSADELLAVARHVHRDAALEPWISVEAPPYRRLDVVLMKRLEPGREPLHIGVMMDERRMLHTTESVDSHVVPLSAAAIPFRIVGVHRHRSLA